MALNAVLAGELSVETAERRSKVMCSLLTPSSERRSCTP